MTTSAASPPGDHLGLGHAVAGCACAPCLARRVMDPRRDGRKRPRLERLDGIRAHLRSRLESGRTGWVRQEELYGFVERAYAVSPRVVRDDVKSLYGDPNLEFYFRSVLDPRKVGRDPNARELRNEPLLTFVRWRAPRGSARPAIDDPGLDLEHPKPLQRPLPGKGATVEELRARLACPKCGRLAQIGNFAPCKVAGEKPCFRWLSEARKGRGVS